MATKIYSKTNSNYTLEGKRTDEMNEHERLLADNVCAIKRGQMVWCNKWEQVDDLLNVFDNNEDWGIVDIDGVFLVCPIPNCSRVTKARFQKVINGEEKEIEDSEE